MNLGGTRKPKPAQSSAIDATVPMDDLLGGAKPSRLPEPSAAAPVPQPPPKVPAPVAPFLRRLWISRSSLPKSFSGM